MLSNNNSLLKESTLKQGSLFIIRICPIGENYRKNFASYWSFERLLKEKLADLESLQNNILSAEYDHPVDAKAAETVINRIKLCLELGSNDYAAASEKNSKGQTILEKLKQLEKQDQKINNSSLLLKAA